MEIEPVQSPLTVVLNRLKELRLPKSALKENDIREEDITEMAWRTAIKLARLLGHNPGYWMEIKEFYFLYQGKRPIRNT